MIDRRELRNRLMRSGCFRRKPIRMFAWLIYLVLLICTNIFLLSVADSFFDVVFIAALFAFASVQCGQLGHDAGHNAVFRNKRANYIVGRITSLIIPMDFERWNSTHLPHHANPNHETRDPDVQLHFIAYTPEQASHKKGIARWIVRRQHLLLIPLQTFVGMRSTVMSVRFMFTHGISNFVQGFTLMFLHYCIYIGLPFYFLDPFHAIMFVLLTNVFYGQYLSIVYVPDHIGTDVITDHDHMPFVEHVARTTRHISSDFWLWDAAIYILYGGVNYHVAHHIFADIPRYNLHLASRIVEYYFEENDLPYIKKTIAESYCDIHLFLRNIASTIS